STAGAASDAARSKAPRSDEWLVFAASEPTAPAELFAIGAEGGGERSLTDLNRGWRDEVAPMRPERFRYEREGQTIDGWIVRPHNFEAGKRYPTLLNVHGGPHAQYGHNFFDEF